MNRSKLIGMALVCACAAATAAAQAPPLDVASVLAQARRNNMIIRAGDHGPIETSVTLLKAATEANPSDADLWVALANAYVRQAEAAGQPGGKVAEVFPALSKSRTAFEQALKINPDLAEALAAHGSLLTTFAQFQRDPALAIKGRAEMDRALALKPNSAAVRLRAFTMVNLPADQRDRQAEIADLQFLQRLSGRSKKADYLHLLAGDVQAEAGYPDLARKEYRAADRRNSPVAAMARSRLAALEKGGVSASDISGLRRSLNNCVMCHGD